MTQRASDGANARAHERAVESAINAIDRLGELFGLMGDAETGDGLYELYTTLVADLRALETFEAIRARLRRFERDVYALVGEWIDIAIDIGNEHARKSSEAWGLEPVLIMALEVPVVSLARIAIETAFKAQADRAIALLAMNGGDILLGDGTTPGILTPAPLMGDLARWLVEITNAITETSLDEALTRAGEPKSGWGRQLIATLDDQTTDTCRHAHGQIRAFGVPFDLCCDPWISARNYGFSNMRPPFHWYCRTVIVLVDMSIPMNRLTRLAESMAKVAAERRARGVLPRVQSFSARTAALKGIAGAAP